MSKLEELIAELCPDGVEYVSFGDICSIITKQTGFDYTNHIKNSLIREKKTDFLPYIQTKFFSGKIFNFDTDYYVPYHIVEKFPKITLESRCILLSIVGASIGNIGLFPGDRKCFLGGAICVAKPHESYNVDYLFYYLTSRDGQKQIFNKIKGAGQATVTIEDIRKFKIPVPPLPVQSEIVRILDTFTELTAELTAELTGRKKQYEYYLEKMVNNPLWAEITLRDMLSQPITDGPHETPNFVEQGVPFISAEAIYDSKIDLNKKRGYITKEYDNICAKKYKPQKGDVYMVKSGSTTGKVAMVNFDDDFNIWSPIAAMRVNSSNNSRFLYHLVKSKSIQTQVKKKASYGSQPNLGMRELEKFVVHVPSLEEQNRIVEILDRFDSLCNDISTGLPAEIEARKKQYEYYRDKLLTFKELS